MLSDPAAYPLKPCASSAGFCIKRSVQPGKGRAEKEMQMSVITLSNETIAAFSEVEGLVSEKMTIRVMKKEGKTVASFSSANKAGEVFAASFLTQTPEDAQVEETSTTVSSRLFFGGLKAVSGIEGPFTMTVPNGAGQGAITGRTVNIADIPFLPYECVKNRTNNKAGLFFRIKGRVLGACLSRVSGCAHVYLTVDGPDKITLTGTHETASGSGSASVSAMVMVKLPVIRAVGKGGYEPYLAGDCRKDGMLFGTAFSSEGISRLRSLRTGDEDVTLILTDTLCTIGTDSRMIEVLTISGSQAAANKWTVNMASLAGSLEKTQAASIMINANVFDQALSTMHAASELNFLQGKKALSRLLDFAPSGNGFRMAVGGSEVTPPALKVIQKEAELPAGIPCFALSLVEKACRALGAPAAIAVSLSLSPTNTYIARLLPMRAVKEDSVKADGTVETTEKVVLDETTQVFIAGISRAAALQESAGKEEKKEEAKEDEPDKYGAAV